MCPQRHLFVVEIVENIMAQIARFYRFTSLEIEWCVL
jgi:hypothetical protein